MACAVMHTEEKSQPPPLLYSTTNIGFHLHTKNLFSFKIPAQHFQLTLFEFFGKTFTAAKLLNSADSVLFFIRICTYVKF